MQINSAKSAVLVTLFLASTAVAFAAPKPQPAILDDGRLDKQWFSTDGEFREDDDIDYLWVSPGFDIAGKTLGFVAWPQVKFIGEKAHERDVRDRRLADQMNADMAEAFKDAFGRAFGDRIQLDGKPTLRVEGRIVDCSTGSDAAKILVGFGAGAGNTTIDVRFVDVATGNVVAGFHHRVVSGTDWSTTDSKFFDWLDETADKLSKTGFAELYRKGDRVRN
ncbi:MAG: DUF4410 domain-containing protein [Acidobacteriota bacterium]